MKWSAIRNASSSGVPSERLSSAVLESVRLAEKVLPGKRVAPPVARYSEPVKSADAPPAPNVTLSPEMPTRRSSSTRMPPKLSLPPPVVLSWSPVAPAGRVEDGER